MATTPANTTSTKASTMSFSTIANAKPAATPARGKDLLNKVQRQLIDNANERGINLQDTFATDADWKQFVIAFTLKSLKDIGVSTPDAWNMVFGEGSYKALADSVWQACQPK